VESAKTGSVAAASAARSGTVGHTAIGRRHRWLTYRLLKMAISFELE